MAALLLAWLQLGWLSLAFGFLADELLSLATGERHPERRIRALGLDRLLLLGFLLITGLLSAVSLFLPINLWVNILFIVLGTGLSYRYAADFRSQWQIVRTRWGSLTLATKVTIASVLALALVGNLSSDITDVDAKLYHIQSIMWTKAYAAVPGLGNLHGRLAFNSHYFIANGLFASGFSSQRLLFPIFSFFYASVLIRLALRLETKIKEQHLFGLLLYGMLFAFFLFDGFEFLNTPSTDNIIALVTLQVLLLALEKPRAASREARFLWVGVVLLASLTLKLSIVFLGAALFLVWVRLRPAHLAVFAIAALVFLGPFFARNYILSGYLVYPMPQLDLFEVDWKVPQGLVEIERDYIEAFAKIPEGKLFGGPENEPEMVALFQDLGKGSWMRIWWQENLQFRDKPFIFLNFASIAFLLLALVRGEWRLAGVLAATLAYLACWFYTAPSPRFAIGVIFVNASIVLAYLLRWLVPPFLLPTRKWVMYALSLFALLVLFKHPRYKDGGFTWSARSMLLPHVQPHQDMDVVEGINFTYYTPPVPPASARDPNRVLECHTFPEPCTPYPKPGLMMRGDGLQEGFRLAGARISTLASPPIQ